MVRVPEGFTYSRKVVAYVTHRTNLLVFTQPLSPTAGLQVPSGTIEKGETPQEAVLREVYEESGLEKINLVKGIATCYHDLSAFRPEIQERHFFQIAVTGEVPERWRHYERHQDGVTDPTPIPFDFHWTKLSLPISLIAGQGDFLNRLTL